MKAAHHVTIIMGASGGLGSAVRCKFGDANHFTYNDIINWSQDQGVSLNVRASVERAAVRLKLDHCIVTRIINCAGVNAIARFDAVSLEQAQRIYQTNALALPLVVQVLRKGGILAKGAVICNVISNAAHIPMSHSLMYNASKAAQEMITRQMARELKEYSIFGVNPNKLAGTGMSAEIDGAVMKLRGWSRKQARAYQLAALPAGVETPPDSLAQFIVELMRGEHHPYITGCIFPYGGPQ
jgi:NAD(P)-dependent dehydrogenase (short-subunit alcohol dehydrogenase family)